MNPGKVRRLTDGEDDRIAIYCLFAALDELRIKSPILVKYAAGPDQFNAGDLAVAALDPLRAEARVEADALERNGNESVQSRS
jgi:hypothetical protein